MNLEESMRLTDKATLQYANRLQNSRRKDFNIASMRSRCFEIEW